jgi:ribosome recycling factor
VRNVRRDLIRDLRDFEDEGLISEDDQERGEKEIQEITDKMNKKIEEIGERKEKEIMEV